MKSSVHVETMRLRLSEALLAQVKEKAEREGMTLSELTRQAIRREVRESA